MWLLLSPVFADDILVFGDSWADGSADELQAVLDWNGTGLTVEGYGIGGTTADQYANQYPTAIPDVIDTHPEARWVWLSMGGNDLFANYYAGLGAENAARYDADFRTVLAQVYDTRPDLRVVSFGYDFVNFEQSNECILTAWTYFGSDTSTALINGYFLADIHETLLGIDPDHARYTYVDSVWGTLQQAGGVPGAPNPDRPSPAEYLADCIHPTSQGYGLIHSALYEAYWGLPAPVAAIDGPESVCTGETETWTDLSTGAAEVFWSLDGTDIGSSASVELTFEALGSATLALLAAAGAWEDEASLPIEVVACETQDTSTSDTADPDSADTDASDSGREGDGPGSGDSGDSPAADDSGCGCAESPFRPESLLLVLAGTLSVGFRRRSSWAAVRGTPLSSAPPS